MATDPSTLSSQMSDEQRNDKKDALRRYEDARREQLAAANNLTLGLSAAGIGFCASLIVGKDPQVFTCPANYFFAVAVVLFMLAALSSMGTLWTRLQDFRLTAKKLRLELKNGDQLLIDKIGSQANRLGIFTWRLYRLQLIFFGGGMLSLIVSLNLLFHHRIFS